MTRPSLSFSPAWKDLCVPRLGLAHLTRQAFKGEDLLPLWNALMQTATDDAAGSGMGMDLSVIAQLRGDKDTGLAIQRDTLKLQQLFRPAREPDSQHLRVLAFAAASDIGANTPIEFLLEGAPVDLAICHVVPGQKLPEPMPAHDIAIVIASATEDGEATLAAVEEVQDHWPCPVLNAPDRIRNLERDRLCALLEGTPGLTIPPTARVDRADLERLAKGEVDADDLLPDGAFPLIVRPLGSHAGFGLERLAANGDVTSYLAAWPEDEFFLSRFVDYSSPDGQFRKYRLVMIGGKAYACHMAIADGWKVWYLNADMALSVPNRVEEATFMEFFDTDFAIRHAGALAEMAARVGLDYFIVDCAQTPDGKLLIFEADNSAIVHDMDPPSVYPYKIPQMHKIFAGFAAMLRERSAAARPCPA